ncbi:MAG TPA: recombination mediator RecR [Bacillota bacterium]|jgi:recombination protein RecR|nr:recombination protein RecR [Fastidiosipila sp.]HPX92771.1 recombination mediator RecR [Bacillota bacterium]HQB80668.1 recombination mediator RecR [Bacillota bacterium]
MAYRFSPAIAQLINTLAKLPGIGQKTAQRLAFHILDESREDALALAEAIQQACESVRLCSECCNLTEEDPCQICTARSRDRTRICIVENPRDVAAMERIHDFRGLYHVLHGVISPMHDMGPEDIKLKELFQRLQNHSEVEEIILATNPTIEGEATALYIARLLKPSGIKVTRIAHGIPMGAALEYADEVTLARAFQNRQEV